MLPLRSVGRKLLGLIALALDLDEGFFEQIGALNDPTAVVRLLRYPGISMYINETLCTCYVVLGEVISGKTHIQGVPV